MKELLALDRLTPNSYWTISVWMGAIVGPAGFVSGDTGVHRWDWNWMPGWYTHLTTYGSNNILHPISLKGTFTIAVSDECKHSESHN